MNLLRVSAQYFLSPLNISCTASIERRLDSGRNPTHTHLYAVSPTGQNNRKLSIRLGLNKKE